MQILIDIDENRFRDIQRISTVQLKKRTPTLEQVIANGTLLLKGHGRLIDADSFKETLDYYIQEAGWSKEHNESLEWCKEFIDAELTIIEADKEV